MGKTQFSIESTGQTSLPHDFWAIFSFLIPFVCGGTILAFSAYQQILDHPTANTVGELIFAVPLSYVLMGTIFGLCGLGIYRLFKAITQFQRRAY